MPRREHKPEQDKLRYRDLLRVYKVFGSHYKSYWRQLALAYCGMLCNVFITLLLPWPLKLILDYVILQHPLPQEAAFITRWLGTEPLTLLLALALSYAFLHLLDSFVSFWHKVGMLMVGVRMKNEIRQRIFGHLLRLSLSYHGRARGGDLAYRLTSDVQRLPALLLSLPQSFFYRIFVIGSHISLMWAMEWRLALVAFSVIPILSYYQRRIGLGLQKASRKKRNKESDVTSMIAENVTAMALVQAYGREDTQQQRFQSENRQSLEFGLSAMKLSKLFKRTSDILVALGTAGVLYYGATLAWSGAILPGTLVLFASYLRKLYSPIDRFASLLLDAAQAQVAADRLIEVVECDMVIKDAPHAITAPPLQGRIEYRNVTFAYDTGGDVLRNVNLLVTPGEKVAVVGHSGAGKSTFVSLLLRFYEPQQGAILIDGHELQDFTVKSLRAQITVLLQDAKLFKASVRENIGFGKLEATEEEIMRAAQLAQAHEFIMQMPQGYDTLISEGGDNLSGGQRQRLNIARAIIRNTPILILDEPATALDAVTEAKIHEALEELTKGKTTFIIAHKFSTLASANKILLLEKGMPAACGTHEQLMAISRTYRELYELQLAPQQTLDEVNGGRWAETAPA